MVTESWTVSLLREILQVAYLFLQSSSPVHIQAAVNWTEDIHIILRRDSSPEWPVSKMPFAWKRAIKIIHNKIHVFGLRRSCALHELLLASDGIWFKSLWIIPVELWFIGHRAIMACSCSVWEKMCVFVCVGACLTVCWWGRGNKRHRLHVWPAHRISPSILLKMDTTTPHPTWTRCDPQIPSSSQQRDYGSDTLIYFYAFTHVKSFPRELWHQRFSEPEHVENLWWNLFSSSA